MEDKFLNVNEGLNPKTKQELDDVKAVIRDTLTDFHNYVFPKYIKNYKDYL